MLISKGIFRYIVIYIIQLNGLRHLNSMTDNFRLQNDNNSNTKAALCQIARKHIL